MLLRIYTHSATNIAESAGSMLLSQGCILLSQGCTVKPQNKGHIGDGPFAPCREVVLFSEVFFLTYWKVLKNKINS